jgi:hypothetical protein
MAAMFLLGYGVRDFAWVKAFSPKPSYCLQEPQTFRHSGNDSRTREVKGNPDSGATPFCLGEKA